MKLILGLVCLLQKMVGSCAEALERKAEAHGASVKINAHLNIGLYYGGSGLIMALKSLPSF